MLSLPTFLLWLSVMSPLIFSPGPANLSVAGGASKDGFKSVMPFIAGISVVNLSMLLIIGFSFGKLHNGAPILFKVIEFLGAIYICYLSSCFIKKSSMHLKDNTTESKLSFSNGLILQILNGKFYPTAIMMFSIFLDNQTHIKQDVIIISFMLTGLALVSYLLWASIGSLIEQKLSAEKALFIQRYLFGGLLLLTGLWFVFENIHYWYLYL